MARITLGSLINSIKGSIGEMVYSTWKGISYVRSKAVTISNPQSADQANVRARLAECAKYWYDTLNQAQRDAWETYAAAIPTPTSGPGDIIKPGKGPFSGFNAFVRNNLNSFTAGISALGAFIAIAPIGITPPGAPVSVTASYAATVITTAWTPAVVAGNRVRVWIRSVSNKFHAQVIATIAVATATIDLSTIAGKLGRYIPFTAAPGMYDVQVDVVDTNGQPSPASNLVKNVVVS